jgi:hypothetical protein
MQFLVYGLDPMTEDAPPPSPEMLAELGKFTEEAVRAGKVIATGALQPTSKRLKRTNGQFTVTDGPFIEAKELLGGFAVIQADSLEEALAWCKRFRDIVGDGESEIVRIFGPQDFHPG